MKNELNYVDTTKVSIRKINKNIAKKIIIANHYTHAWTSCRYALGIYYKDENSSYFGETKLIGCLVYGHPVGAAAAESVSPALDKGSVLELKRLWIEDGYGKNIESYCISESFNWLRKNAPNIKALISYADTAEDHLGTIYQATNWLYQGRSADIQLMDNYNISLQKDPYHWIHSRTCFSRWGSNNLEHLKREIGKEGYTEFWRQKAMGKHRYVYILETNKGKKKKIKRNLKHEIKPYPKSNFEEVPEIEHYETYKPEDENGNDFW